MTTSAKGSQRPNPKYDTSISDITTHAHCADCPSIFYGSTRAIKARRHAHQLGHTTHVLLIIDTTHNPKPGQRHRKDPHP